MPRRLALLLVLPLLLAPIACGDDEDAEGGSGTEVDGEADQQTVDDALELIVDGLVDEGFEADPEDDDDDDSDLEFESGECRDFAEAFDDDLPGESASAESGEFARGELAPGSVEETVEVNVGLAEEADDLDEMFDVLGDDSFATCMEEALRRSFDEQSAESAGEGGPEITIEGLTVDPISTEIGDESAGLQVRASFLAAGFEFPFVLEVEFAREGRAAAMAMVGVIGDDTLVVDRAALLTTALSAVTAAS